MKEIERKFLVSSSSILPIKESKKFVIQQGYLQRSKEVTVRVRIKNDTGYLTIKGESKGFTRDEFEYEIPLSDAQNLLLLCGHSVIDKIRYEVLYEGKIWELDIFQGKLSGLCLAEIELENENETFKKPVWIDEEVSLDTRFFNSNLVSIENISELNL